MVFFFWFIRKRPTLSWKEWWPIFRLNYTPSGKSAYMSRWTRDFTPWTSSRANSLRNLIWNSKCWMNKPSEGEKSLYSSLRELEKKNGSIIAQFDLNKKVLFLKKIFCPNWRILFVGGSSSCVGVFRGRRRRRFAVICVIFILYFFSL